MPQLSFLSKVYNFFQDFHMLAIDRSVYKPIENKLISTTVSYDSLLMDTHINRYIKRSVYCQYG